MPCQQRPPSKMIINHVNNDHLSITQQVLGNHDHLLATTTCQQLLPVLQRLPVNNDHVTTVAVFQQRPSFNNSYQTTTPPV
jgi:hypothetical protein